MKQGLHEPRANCQTRLDIVNTKSRKSSTLFSIPSDDGISDIFLIRNKGKGPPGRTLDSGIAYCLIKYNKLEAFSTSHLEPVEGSKAPIENKLITHINKSKNLSQLNFTIMKKQILFLMFFVLAVFADITDSYGQTPIGLSNNPTSCITPTPIDATCVTNDALHPIPGKEYTYTVDVPTPTGTKKFNWFVTTDKNFITTDGTTFVTTLTTAIEKNDGTDLHILTSGTGYHDPASTGTTEIKMTWKPFPYDVNNPVFLVIYVTNEGTAPNTCTTDNIQVYVIKPVHSFTLDVANIGLDGTPGTIGTASDGPCAANVTSAVYDVAAEKVLMKYGTNFLFFIVNAANYNDSWLPSFQVSGDGITGTAGDRSVTAIDWQYSAAAATATGWKPMTIAGADVSGTYTYTATTTADPVMASATSGGIVPAVGECIIVRVTVDNGRIETIAPENIVFAADGIMKDPAATTAANYYTNLTLGDIHTNAGAALPAQACPWVDGYVNDRVTQHILPRPDIKDAITPAPSGTFIPKN